MSLVARSDASRTAPFHPLRKHILHDQIGKRLPIVAFETRHDFRIALTGGKSIPMFLQIVPTLLLEQLKETRRPSGTVVFERIMVHPHRTRRFVLVERSGKRTQESIHRLNRIRIHHQPFSSRTGTFHQLPGRSGFNIRRLAIETIFKLPASIRRINLRPAETPSASCGEINAQPMLCTYSDRIRKRTHPLFRQIPAIFAFMPLCSINRYYMETAKALFRQRGALSLQTILINSRPHPPIIDPWL